MVIFAMVKRKPRPARRPAPTAARAEAPPAAAHWLFGLHAVLAAAANPDRRCRRLLAVAATAGRLAQAAAAAGVMRPPVETLDRQGFDALFADGSVHQGVAALAEPLPEPSLSALLATLGDAGDCRLVVLDQVTDPRNAGAVLRSAAAFGAVAVVVQDRHAPAATGALAKAASGALEWVPMVREVNLARSLRSLQAAGFWCLGLDPAAPATLAEARRRGRVAVVLGAEGSGLRRLVGETCDERVRIPITARAASLNVAAAAAIALYELCRSP
jgi:23S rRNA (guanosine2251-2'-O)-methyltransferase